MVMQRLFRTFTFLCLAVGASCVAAPVEIPQAEQRQQPQRPSRDRGRGREATGPSLVVGQTAPEFRLKSLDGESETSLSELRKNKPVILMFGSYT